jgi:hypothetical protein
MLVLTEPLFLWLIVVCVRNGHHGHSDDAAGVFVVVTRWKSWRADNGISEMNAAQVVKKT